LQTLAWKSILRIFQLLSEEDNRTLSE